MLFANMSSSGSLRSNVAMRAEQMEAGFVGFLPGFRSELKPASLKSETMQAKILLLYRIIVFCTLDPSSHIS